MITPAAQTSAILGLPIEITEQFSESSAAFLRGNYNRLGDYSFLVVLKNSESKGEPLSVQSVFKNVNSGKPILFVNQDLVLLEAREGEATHSFCSKLTKQEDLFAVLVSGGYAWEFLQGITVAERWCKPGAGGLPTVSKFHRPIEEFDALLQDHLIKQLNSGLVYFWNNRDKRIFSVQPQGTELIFHGSLFSWLDLHVFPKLKIYAEPKGLGQDRTDIIVVTNHGSFVIEVKWLGKNENGTEYDQPPRIDEGLAQVKIYLDNDSSLVCGHLVCYDGRTKDVHDKESNWNDSLRHLLCTAPKILFLSSDVPSKLAKVIAKAGKV